MAIYIGVLLLDNLTTLYFGMLMKTLQVGDLKSRFSSVLEAVRRGEEIAISFGKRREKLAVIVPYSKYKKGVRRKLGILKGRASFEVHQGFKSSDEELLNP